MHKILLYFTLKAPNKDLHPPTAISSEMQDISEKKYNILYKQSASRLIQFVTMS